MQTCDYSKISITAKLVSHYRRFSDIPFAEDVADYVGAEQALTEIRSKFPLDSNVNQEEVAEESKMYAPLLESRYKSVVEAIAKSGIKQVLELASGFSLRGLAMTQNPEIFYVESDLSGINDEKNKLIPSLRDKYRLSDFNNHQVVTANALERNELESAVDGLKRDQPLAVVFEGLLPYLSAEERSTIAGNICYLLGQFAGGAWITPDITTKETASDLSEFRERFRAAIRGVTDRQLHESAFETEEEILDFIAEHGFTGTCSYQMDLVKELVSIERLKVKPEIVERLKSRMKIWVLSRE